MNEIAYQLVHNLPCEEELVIRKISEPYSLMIVRRKKNKDGTTTTATELLDMGQLLDSKVDMIEPALWRTAQGVRG